jgi:hypothetical protein
MAGPGNSAAGTETLEGNPSFKAGRLSRIPKVDPPWPTQPASARIKEPVTILTAYSIESAVAGSVGYG